MISCIICSRQKDILTELNKNISSTIGCEHELIVIDNSQNQYSIFSAYNEGVRLATGDILCFMHEDIIYRTQDWGKAVSSYFATHPNAGMIGVAGTHFLSSIPSGWWETECNSSHLLQGFVEDGQYKTYFSNLFEYKSEITQVVAVDGLWLCMPKSIFEFVQWDSITFKGFHGYDVDMSLQVWSIGYEVHIIWDVLLEHKSLGNAGDDFYETYDILWNKWNGRLPIVKGIELLKTEQEARTKIVDLKRHIREQHRYIRNIYNSYPHRLGALILLPLKKIIEWFKF